MRSVTTAIAIGIVTATATPALADWGKTKWGMTPDEVVAAANAAGERITEPARCPLSWASSSEQWLVESAATWMGTEFVTSYYFGTDGLRYVRLWYMQDIEGDVFPTAKQVCRKIYDGLTRQLGQPKSGKSNYNDHYDWTDGAAGHVIRLSGTSFSCDVKVAKPSYADAGFETKRHPRQCFEKIWVGYKATENLTGPSACVSDEAQGIISRTFRIVQPTQVAASMVSEATATEYMLWRAPSRGDGELVRQAAAEKKAFPTEWIGRFEGTLQPGCYELQLYTAAPTKDEADDVEVAFELVSPAREAERTKVRAAKRARAAAQAKRIIARPAGEDDDDFAVVDGDDQETQAPPLPRGKPVHLDSAFAAAMLDAGNLYGASASFAIELNRRARVRALVGISAGLLLQSVEMPLPASNKMLPGAAWAGARVLLARHVTATARAGVMGYYIATDVEDRYLGSVDRSETGGGLTVGLSLKLGPVVIGVDRWFLGEALDVLQLGVGF